MEEELKRHLLASAAAFERLTGKKEATIADQAAGDWRFFARLRTDKSFLASKYDSVMAWFSVNWPEDAEWPDSVPRPVRCAPLRVGAAA